MSDDYEASSTIQEPPLGVVHIVLKFSQWPEHAVWEGLGEEDANLKNRGMEGGAEGE